MSASQTTLCVFAKAPELGRVKTRLAADLGEHRALAVYRQLLQRTYAVALEWPGPVRLQLTGHPDAMDPRWRRWPWDGQAGEDLGARLRHGLRPALAHGAHAIAIGSDCAELEAPHLLRIAELLDSRDAVLGPCDDGGYWALGLANEAALACCCASDLPWSRPELVRATRRRCVEQGLELGLADRLRDIDVLEDLMNSPLAAEAERG